MVTGHDKGEPIRIVHTTSGGKNVFVRRLSFYNDGDRIAKSSKFSYNGHLYTYDDVVHTLTGRGPGYFTIESTRHLTDTVYQTDIRYEKFKLEVSPPPSKGIYAWDIEYSSWQRLKIDSVGPYDKVTLVWSEEMKSSKEGDTFNPYGAETWTHFDRISFYGHILFVEDDIEVRANLDKFYIKTYTGYKEMAAMPLKIPCEVHGIPPSLWKETGYSNLEDWILHPSRSIS